MSDILGVKNLMFNDGASPIAPSQSEAIDVKNIIYAEKPSVVDEEPSTLSDFITAAGQGLTFGGSDELLAAIKSLGSDTKYADQLEIERGRIKAAADRSKIASFAGEIIGGLLPALLTGGGSAAATLGARALAAARTGAGMGALTAYGKTEASRLENPLTVLKEMAEGGVAGGLMGGLMSGGAGLTKSAIKKATELSPTAKLTALSAKESAAGRPWTSDAGRELSRVEESSTISDFLKKMYGKKGDDAVLTPGLKQIQGEKIAESLREASKAGILIGDRPDTLMGLNKVFSIFEQRPGLFNEKEKKALADLFEDFTKTGGKGIDPTIANDARRALKAVLFKIKDKEPVDILNPIEELGSALKTELTEKSAGFKQANLAYATTRNISETLTKAYESDLKNVNKKVTTGIQQLMSRAGKLGKQGLDSENILKDMQDSTKKAFDLDPDSFLKVGIHSPGELLKSVKYQSQISAIRQGMMGQEGNPGDIPSTVGKLLNYAHPYRLGQYAGVGAKYSKLAYVAPDNVLLKLADKMSSGKYKKLGDSLRNAIDTNNSLAKKSIIFSVMQQSELDKYFDSFFKSEIESQQ